MISPMTAKPNDAQLMTFFNNNTTLFHSRYSFRSTPGTPNFKYSRHSKLFYIKPDQIHLHNAQLKI